MNLEFYVFLTGLDVYRTGLKLRFPNEGGILRVPNGS